MMGLAVVVMAGQVDFAVFFEELHNRGSVQTYLLIENV